MDRVRLAEMFRRCTARLPKPHELDRLTKRLAVLRHDYAKDPESAARLLATGESPADAKLPSAELAAWTGIASILLNLDEAITKE